MYSLYTQRVFERELAEICELSSDDLSSISGSHIFITGGTGYIGKWLVEAISYANEHKNLDIKISILTRKPELFAKRYPHLVNGRTVKLIKGDVSDFDDVTEGYTHLIHAATDVVEACDPIQIFDTTVLGTRRVMRFAAEKEISSVLLLSSGAVYSSTPDTVERISEEWATGFNVDQPSSSYALGKNVTEWLGTIYGKEYGIRCNAARVFAQVGPYLALDAHYAVGNFIRDALENREIEIKSDGSTIRSYLYSTDLVTWLLAILVRGVPGRAYNVGSDDPISIKSLASAVLNQCYPEERLQGIRILGNSVPGVAPSRYVPDVSRAKVELGLSVRVSLAEALNRTIEWNRQFMVRS